MRYFAITLCIYFLFGCYKSRNELNLVSKKIGDQTWAAENLSTTRYANGDAIPYVSDSLKWASLKQGAYCYYNNDVSKKIILYNYYAVNDSRGLAPKGWHIPNDIELNILMDNLKGYPISQLSNGGISINNFPIYFDGCRSDGANFNSIGEYFFLWSIDDRNDTHANGILFYFKNKEFEHFYTWKRNAVSVRLIKN
jgi:uncharacterized protein (TIGR02145 family)